MDGEETTITVHEATGVEGGIPAGTQIVQLEDGSTVHIDPSALQVRNKPYQTATLLPLATKGLRE